MAFPTYQSKDEIPEPFRADYIERNGEWVPNIEDVSGLKASQRRALEEKKQLEASIKAALGDRDLTEVAELLKKQREIEEAQARKAGDFDKIVEKRVNETKAEYEKRLAELAPYKSKYEQRELESAIRKAAIPAGVDPKDLEEYVIPLVMQRRIRLDGEKVVVLDKDGDPTGLTPEKFFAETFKAEAPKFYQAAGGSGGGATGGSGNRSASTGSVASDIQDFVSRITADKTALQQAQAGQLTVRG